jgi:hypothetical protein
MGIRHGEDPDTAVPGVAVRVGLGQVPPDSDLDHPAESMRPSSMAHQKGVP